MIWFILGAWIGASVALLGLAYVLDRRARRWWR